MRRDPRFASPRGLVVRCESWGEFVERYASDISQGGMYIVTDQAPAILSEIDVILQLPEGHEIQLRASVVHVLDAERAALEGREPGLGVQFIELDAPRKAQIYQLVEYARWEGSAGGSSLASRLFEVSASLPPSKIMEALPVDTRSAPPGASRRPAPASSSAAPALRGGASASAVSATPSASQRAAAGSARPRKQVSKAPTPEPGSFKAPTPPPGSFKAPTPPPGSFKAPTPPPGSFKAPTPPPGSFRAPTPPPGSVPAASTPAPAEEQPAEQAPQQPSQPLDLEKLKLGMTHLAHKRFEQAMKVFTELAHDSYADPQAHIWLALSQARIKLRDNDEAAAAEHYRRVLALDETHHEARKFVRDYHAKRRLSAIPFGRYFVKK